MNPTLHNPLVKTRTHWPELFELGATETEQT